MQEDTIRYDTLAARPLPKWLTDQKEGLTVYKPREIIIKEDHSLDISVIVTCLFILLTVIILTVWFKKRIRKNNS
jgi:heme/copper-type cytochrome/quinol oxidase subunit 2